MFIIERERKDKTGVGGREIVKERQVKSRQKGFIYTWAMRKEEKAKQMQEKEEEK